MRMDVGGHLNAEATPINEKMIPVAIWSPDVKHLRQVKQNKESGLNTRPHQLHGLL